MLSNNPTSSIQKRRQLHRRQNSTPTIFEAPHVRPLAVMAQRQSAHRRGLSLDQKPQMLRSPFTSERMPAGLMSQEGGSSMVSITNPGQPQQHTLQVAQQHRLAQPGPQFQHFQDKQPQVHQNSQNQTIAQEVQPSAQQLKELEQHIKSIYGDTAMVQVNIVPSPVATPQKSSPMVPLDHLDIAPMPSSLSDAASINLEPPEDHGFNFNLDNPESDMGYESSYYSSSPCRSPSGSPQSRSIATFEVAGRLAPPPPRLSFSRGPNLMPAPSNLDGSYENLSPTSRSPFSSPLAQAVSLRADSIAEMNLDATIEDTGVSAEEIQQYISEQDPATHRWACMYPECDKTFGRRENIRSHVQTHLGDRQFRCNHCSKCFVRQHDLKRHAKIHTGDKPYKCPCGAGFARQDALTRHRQRGMCDGAFPNAVRKEVRRGRPRKKRPDLEERAEKAFLTRMAAMSSHNSSSSSVGTSPASSGYSHHDTDFNGVFPSETQQFVTTMHNLQTQHENMDTFSFDNTHSPFDDGSVQDDGYVEAQGNELFAYLMKGQFQDGDQTQTSPTNAPNSPQAQTPPVCSVTSPQTHTPPMSPANSPPIRNKSIPIAAPADTPTLNVRKKGADNNGFNKATRAERDFSGQSGYSTPPNSPPAPRAISFGDFGEAAVSGAGADFTMFSDACMGAMGDSIYGADSMELFQMN